jgi:hypothetical protein
MSKMSDYDRTHVGRVMREGDWFTAKVFQLLHKSDPENRERLRLGLPEEVAAYEAWLAFGDQDDEVPASH